MTLGDFLNELFEPIQKKRLAWSIITIVIFTAIATFANFINVLVTFIQQFIQ